MKGHGTLASPYILERVEDFYKISENPNAHYEQACELIGVKNIPMFSGVYNGKNYCLIPDENNGSPLFGDVNSAVIKRINMYFDYNGCPCFAENIDKSLLVDVEIKVLSRIKKEGGTLLCSALVGSTLNSISVRGENGDDILFDTCSHYSFATNIYSQKMKLLYNDSDNTFMCFNVQIEK